MRALVLAIAVVAALAGGCGTGAYNVAYRGSHGNALAAPPTSKGFTSSVRYREYGGPLGKLILLLLHAPSEPKGKTESKLVSQSRTCGGGSCTVSTTTRTTYTPPTAEERAEYRKQKKEFEKVTAPAILAGTIRAEVNLDVASRSLGGDTEGLAMSALGTLVGEADAGWAFALKVGIGASGYTMYGRTTRHLSLEIDPMTMTPDAVRVDTTTGDVKSSYFGMPVRLVVATPLRFAAYYQFDWSLLRLVSGAGTQPGESYHPQLSTFGIETVLFHLHVGAELQLDQLNVSSRTFALEAGLVF